eukprot:sb/3478800/
MYNYGARARKSGENSIGRRRAARVIKSKLFKQKMVKFPLPGSRDFFSNVLEFPCTCLETMSFIREKTRFSLLRSTLVALRGTKRRVVPVSVEDVDFRDK